MNFLSDLTQCMLIDIYRFKRQYQRISRIQDAIQKQQRLQHLESQIQRSILKRKLREQNVPALFYSDLPIIKHKDHIIDALKNNKVIIVAGETGSGKSTQLPKICLEAGFGRAGLIGHTQPRRIAAKSLAARVAQELNVAVGEAVGYEIRFEKKIQDNSYIKLMTDGILLQETTHQKWLQQYDCIIIDEAHERSLNIDFLLGYLKRLLQKRNDLKVIITSATIELEIFEKYFNAPVISVAGRSYPVEVQHAGTDFQLHSDDTALQVTQAVEMAIGRGIGDILIFQSGEKEIHEVAETLNEKRLNIEVLPLYAKLNIRSQQKIFQQAKRRKVIIATNIAETALTVPNIRFVIDNGQARMSRYNYRTKMQRLNIEAISKASCEQRKGRCGRVGPGICYRLYTQEDYDARDPYTTPEILRTDLSSVLLKMLALNIEDIESFGFISEPDSRYIKDGLALLERLQAITDQKLTTIGRLLAQLPIAPRLGRILIAAKQYHALKEILIIVSFLSIEDVRERPIEEREKAQSAHAQFNDESSDFMTILNIWCFLFEHKKKLSHNQFRKACQQNYLSYVRVCEWFDVHEQLKTRLKEEQFRENQIPADYASIHKSLLSGFVDTIGLKEDKKEYLGARHNKFSLHPSSVLFSKPPTWIVSQAIVHTTKNYARMNAKIEAPWLEEVAAHLIKKQYSEPHFDVQTQNVIASERAFLFGLLVNQKRISYEKIDPVESRKIFIQSALCEQLLETRLNFFQKNNHTIDEIVYLEDRIRRQQILYDESRVYEFYDQTIPSDVFSRRTLEEWCKKNDPSLLIFTAADIYAQTPDPQLLEDFSDQKIIKGINLSVTYKFDMAASDDGATIHIPVDKLKYFVDVDFSFPAKGFIKDKIAFYLKNLPKSIRNSLLPLNTHIENIFQIAQESTDSIDQIIFDYIKSTLDFSLKSNWFNENALPPYLKTHFKIKDHEEIIAQGDDLHVLYKLLVSQNLIHQDQNELEKKNITIWDFGDLPVEISSSSQSQLKLYPALVDAKSSVEIQLFHSKALSDVHHATGLVRLYCFHHAKIIKQAHQSLKPFKKEIQKNYPFGESSELIDDLAFTLSESVFVEEHEKIRTQNHFLARCQAKSGEYSQMLMQSIPFTVKLLEDWTRFKKYLDHSKWNPSVKKALELQCSILFYPGFFASTPYFWLRRYPVYLKAMEERLEKYLRLPQKDLELSQTVERIEKAYHEKLLEHDLNIYPRNDPLRLFRWKIEEFRVSLFAQSLRTVESVSEIRLLKMLKEIK